MAIFGDLLNLCLSSPKFNFINGNPYFLLQICFLRQILRLDRYFDGQFLGLLDLMFVFSYKMFYFTWVVLLQHILIFQSKT